MASENQSSAGVALSFRGILGNLLSGVVNIFASSVKKSGQDFDKSADQLGEGGTEQAVDVVTTVVQDKVQAAVSCAMGGSALGSVASGVVGAMAGAVAGELVDTVLDTVSGTELGKEKVSQGCAGLGALTPFDDTSEIYAHVRKVVRHFEGNTASPCIPELGKSSATISTGLDLGQHDVKSLQKMGIADDTIAILKPLLKQNAGSARKILKKKNIVLTDKQNAAVEQAIILHYMGTTADAYDAALEKNAASCTDAGEDWAPEKPFVATCFSMLPKEIQAVMVSVLFQHGSPQAVPRFWSFATQGQWNEVVAELRAFYSEPTVLSGRRNEEADMILFGMGRIMQGLRAL